MTSHLVRLAAGATYTAPGGWAAGATGHRRWAVVTEGAGSVHTGFNVGLLDPGGTVPAHVHSFEESVYVLDGYGVLDTADGSVRLGPGDYALLPVGVAHAWHNDGTEPVRWAEMQGPVPRDRFDGDTILVPPLAVREPVPVDVRDPRTRRFGAITPEHMDATKQQQRMLAVSA